MAEEKNGKIERTLGIYTRLMNGYVVRKVEEAVRYNVNERSIQRDIDDIRAFLENDFNDQGVINSVIYDRAVQGYRLEQLYKLRLTNAEILAVCKILLDSRAFTKIEMQTVIQKLIECCVPEANRKSVNELISNELFHYVEPRHNTDFLETLWNLGQAIRQNKYIKISYLRLKDKSIVERKVKPVAIMFNEFYFYLTAFIDDPEVRRDFEVMEDAFPTIYRLDRIKNLEVLDEKFRIPYNERFEEGEFRKRVQFMYGGRLQRIKFKYTGDDVDAILDKLPTAKILSEENGTFTLSAEVFGKGIDMWLRSQGEYIQMV